MTGRRHFLQLAGSVSVAPGLALAASESPSSPHMLQRGDFAPLLGHVFDVDAGTARMRLVEVGALPNCSDRECSFHLQFQVISGQPVPQGSWTIEHPRLGSHLVFLSPNDANAMQVEAVFNRG